MEQLEMLRRATDLAERQVRAAAAAPDAATACAEWDARALVNHLVGGMQVMAAWMAGQPPPFDPAAMPRLLGDDWGADFREAAEAALAAFGAPGAAEQMVNGPGGQMPGAALADLALCDLYVHTWDLARATGIEGEYPEEITAAVDAFARRAFAGARPPQVLDPPVDVPEDAPAIERLVAFCGRRP